MSNKYSISPAQEITLPREFKLPSSDSHCTRTQVNALLHPCQLHQTPSPHIAAHAVNLSTLGWRTTGTGSRSSLSNAASVVATGSLTSSRISASKLSSSRLLAPTASSLAKAIFNKPYVSGSKSSARNAAEGSSAQILKSQSTGSDTLSMITNRMSSEPWSPSPKKIFSKPLAVPCGIPTTTRKHPEVEEGGMEKDNVKEAEIATVPIKQRSLNGRKPRISRSKVIAKLASQRAASASWPGSTPGMKTGRTRSSLGVKAQRSSYGGKSVNLKGVEDSVLMSAKKRARQSEYARRKSHAASIDPGKEAHTIDVDGE